MTALNPLLESASSIPPPPATVLNLPIIRRVDLKDGPPVRIRECFGQPSGENAGIPRLLGA
jgi:hypothetical protein